MIAETVRKLITGFTLCQGGGSSEDTIWIGILFALILTISILGMAR